MLQEEMYPPSRMIIMAIIITVILGQDAVSSVFTKKDDSQVIEEFISSRKLREAGLTDFEVSHFKHTENGNSVSSSTIRRRKRSSSDQTPIALSVSAHGDTFQLNLWHVQSVLHPDATIVMRAGDTEETKWTGIHPNCFLRGSVTSHGGAASMSYCNELQGIFDVGEHEYHIETLPKHVQTQLTTSKKSINNILVGKRRKPPVMKHLHIPDNVVKMEVESEIQESHSSQQRTRRETPGTDVEIETAVYTDQLMTAILEPGGDTSVEGKIERLLVKWNGVQYEWGKHVQLGYNVTITIKKMVFFVLNPTWYNASTSLGSTLSIFCKGVKNEPPFDHIHMHTGQSNTNVTGMAYQSQACRSRYRCAVSADSLISTFYITAHELGHNMGMYHDGDLNCTADDTGTMGAKTTDWSSCSKKSLHTFLQKDIAKCLFVQNITAVQQEMESIQLSGILPGLRYTEDEICSLTKGEGWRHRSLPYWDLCNWRSCVDMKIGSPTYGQIVNYKTGISGQYCGEGKVCHNAGCMTWAETSLDQSFFKVVHGGWGNWLDWTSCSRTCGRSVQFRKRICDNPKPRNSPTCEGDEYQSAFCSLKPCENDSTVDEILIQQRAGEMCTNLINSGVIRADQFDGTGNRYHYMDYAVCEVKCTAKDGFKPSNYARYCLMPDGTPCKKNSFDKNYSEEIGGPRISGRTLACLQGYCKVYGCDGTLNNTKRDSCGVCMGDNSTCYVHEGVSFVETSKGERVEIVTLPNGTYDILFHFTWKDMKSVYLELWSTGDSEKPIIASYIAGSSSIFDNRNDPLKFAETEWTFFFVGQYLFAKGPITEPVTIKLFQQSTNPNIGVYYAYSVPRPPPKVTTTQSTSTTVQSTTTTVSSSTTQPETSVDTSTRSVEYSTQTTYTQSTDIMTTQTGVTQTTDCQGPLCQDSNRTYSCGDDDVAICSAESWYLSFLVLMLCIFTVMMEHVEL